MDPNGSIWFHLCTVSYGNTMTFKSLRTTALHYSRCSHSSRVASITADNDVELIAYTSNQCQRAGHKMFCSLCLNKWFSTWILMDSVGSF